jgi:hypothetical protein
MQTSVAAGSCAVTLRTGGAAAARAAVPSFRRRPGDAVFLGGSVFLRHRFLLPSCCGQAHAL